MTELQVLVVEDNAADAFRVREALEKAGKGRFRPTFAGALGEAEPRLAEADLVLLDLNLPDACGAEAVARVKARAPSTPVVVLSGERGEDTAFRCLQHGAQDVLLKEHLDADALVRSLSCALERQALARERDEALARARGGEGEMRRVLDALAEGVVVSDSRRRGLFVNPAAEVLLGWGVGAGLRRVVDLPADGIGGPDTGRVGVDGRPAVLEVRSRPVRWEGHPARLTTLREIQAPPSPAHRWRRAPEGRVDGERFEAVRALAGGVARELAENLGDLLEGAYGPDAGCSAPVRQAVGRIFGLVRRLQATAGHADAPVEALDLSELVDGVWPRFHVEEGRVSPLVKDLAIGLPRVRAGRAPLEEAVRLLVEHGLATAGEGSVTVSTLLAEPAPGTGWRSGIRVAGDAPGTGGRSDERILEPYALVPAPGTGGLGLAPVRGIVHQYGGSVEVATIPGRGTAITILLPVPTEEVGGRSEAEESTGPDPMPGPWFPPRIAGLA